MGILVRGWEGRLIELELMLAALGESSYKWSITLSWMLLGSRGHSVTGNLLHLCTGRWTRARPQR